MVTSFRVTHLDLVLLRQQQDVLKSTKKTEKRAASNEGETTDKHGLKEKNESSRKIKENQNKHQKDKKMKLVKGRKKQRLRQDWQRKMAKTRRTKIEKQKRIYLQ